MFCPSCGNQFDDQNGLARFCPSCGTRIEVAAQPIPQPKPMAQPPMQPTAAQYPFPAQPTPPPAAAQYQPAPQPMPQAMPDKTQSADKSESFFAKLTGAIKSMDNTHKTIFGVCIAVFVVIVVAIVLIAANSCSPEIAIDQLHAEVEPGPSSDISFVTFTVRVTGAKQDEPIVLRESSGAQVAIMRDDGKECDVRANDGIYTTRVEMLTERVETDTNSYYVTGGDKKTEPKKISEMPPPEPVDSAVVTPDADVVTSATDAYEPKEPEELEGDDDFYAEYYLDILSQFSQLVTSGYSNDDIDEAIARFPDINESVLWGYLSYPNDLYYNYVNLNGNEVPALVVTLDNPSDGREYEYGIAGIYGYTDSGVVEMFEDDGSMAYRSRYYLCADGVIKNDGSGGASLNSIDYYCINPDYSYSEICTFEYDHGTFYYNDSQVSQSEYESEMAAINAKYPDVAGTFYWSKID